MTWDKGSEKAGPKFGEAHNWQSVPRYWWHHYVKSWEMDIDNRLQCGITGAHPVIFYCWIFYGLPGNKSFVSRKLKTVVTVLNIPVHAWTALPRGSWEPVEQDATCHGLLVQRQAETNNAAPYLEGIIPTEVWGYLCWVWEYVMSVAIPMCQLVS